MSKDALQIAKEILLREEKSDAETINDKEELDMQGKKTKVMDPTSDTSSKNASTVATKPSDASSEEIEEEEDYDDENDLEEYNHSDKKDMEEEDDDDEMVESEDKDEEDLEEEEDEEDLEEEEDEDDEEMKEHMAALFGGEKLSEKFRTKAATVFAAAVNSKVQKKAQKISERYDKKLQKATENIAKDLNEKIDDYLTYVVKEWAAENAVALEHGIRREITESFMSDLRNLFERHDINIPESDFGALEEANKKIEKLNNKLSDLIESNIHLSKENEKIEKNLILSEATSDLTANDKNKLFNLIENIAYDSVCDFKEKVEILKESYFNTSINNSSEFVDDTTDASFLKENVNDPKMNEYINFIKRSAKK